MSIAPRPSCRVPSGRGRSLLRPRSGRAAGIALLGLLALAAGVLVLLRQGTGDAERPAEAASPPTSAAPRHGPTPDAVRPPDDVPRSSGPAPGRAPADDAPALSSAVPADPARFDGRGALRGTLELHGDLPPPVTWRLVLEPSRVLEGRERAQPRELELPGSRLDFVVEDLPLGGYDVRARAEGRTGRAVPVLLTRSSPNPFVVLELAPAGSLEGFVVGADALPVEGIEVVLVPTGEGSERRTRTDASGTYRFEGVPDGPYRLFVGDPANPLAQPESLRMQAPGMHLPATELPPLATLEVFVHDENGAYLPGARVIGSGNRGGNVDARTDADGRLVVRNLPAGRVRLRAEHPDDPERSSRRAAVDLHAGERTRVDLVFEP